MAISREWEIPINPDVLIVPLGSTYARIDVQGMKTVDSAGAGTKTSLLAAADGKAKMPSRGMADADAGEGGGLAHFRGRDSARFYLHKIQGYQ
jgi:hypothetical protein